MARRTGQAEVDRRRVGPRHGDGARRDVLANGEEGQDRSESDAGCVEDCARELKVERDPVRSERRQGESALGMSIMRAARPKKGTAQRGVSCSPSHADNRHLSGSQGAPLKVCTFCDALVARMWTKPE